MWAARSSTVSQVGFLDRLKMGNRGVPGRALVLVNRSPGPETGESSLRTMLDVRLAPLPEGAGPEADVRQLVASHQAHLVTAGMEVPAVLDPDSRAPLGVQEESLNEAIGRYYLELEPEHGTWEAAIEAKRKELRRATGVLGDVRHGLDQLKDAGAAAKALPGGLRAAAREWKAGVAAMGNEGHPAGEPFEGVGFDQWVEIRAAMARGSAPPAELGARWDTVNAHWETQVKWNATARAMYEKAMQEGGADAS
jgi:hypothetical protein